jgi:multidrug resistance efflux pump
VNGVVADVFVREGDTVHKGDPILSIYSEAQRLSRENAALATDFNDVNANQGKLTEAKLLIDLSKNKMKNDSALYFRQKELWAQNVGTKVELEQRELAYQNSKTAYFSSVERFTELQRQIDYTASQVQKNLSISSRMESDYTLKSEIDGVVYGINKKTR